MATTSPSTGLAIPTDTTLRRRSLASRRRMPATDILLALHTATTLRRLCILHIRMASVVLDSVVGMGIRWAIR